jgi:hypothetical protein
MQVVDYYSSPPIPRRKSRSPDACSVMNLDEGTFKQRMVLQRWYPGAPQPAATQEPETIDLYWGNAGGEYDLPQEWARDQPAPTPIPPQQKPDLLAAILAAGGCVHGSPMYCSEHLERCIVCLIAVHSGIVEPEDFPVPRPVATELMEEDFDWLDAIQLPEVPEATQTSDAERCDFVVAEEKVLEDHAFVGPIQVTVRDW